MWIIDVNIIVMMVMVMMVIMIMINDKFLHSCYYTGKGLSSITQGAKFYIQDDGDVMMVWIALISHLLLEFDPGHIRLPIF